MYDGRGNGVLSDAEIAGAASAAGFSGTSLTIAVAVALAESSGNPNAKHTNSNGSTDYGLWQINSVHSDLLRGTTWNDPVSNARMAWSISGHGDNWHPWTTYNSGAYRAYLPRARRATGNPAAVPNTVPSGAAPDSLINNGVWKRLAYFLAGGILILVAVIQITGAEKLAGPLAKVLL